MLNDFRCFKTGKELERVAQRNGHQGSCAASLQSLNEIMSDVLQKNFTCDFIVKSKIRHQVLKTETTDF